MAPNRYRYMKKSILHSLVATPTYVCEVCDHTRQYMVIYTLGMQPYIEYMDILIFNI